MGKGTISTHLGAGLYSVTVTADNVGIDAGVARATAESARQAIIVAELEAERTALQSDQLTAEAQLNAAIISGDQNAIDAAVANLSPIRAALAINQRAWYAATSRKFAADKSLTYYSSNRIADSVQSVWAADLTEDLTGEVGLIELGRDGEETPIIYPAGFAGTGAAYDDQRDGTNQSPLSNTGAAAVYNFGMSLGITKWKPRYRFGTITALADGLADVALDPYVREGENMNTVTELLDVPVSYLNCDSYAFSLADPVVIEFTDQDWLQPTIIGFVNNPKRCTPRYYVFQSGTYYTVWDISAGTVAAIINPVTSAPIPMPATAAQMADWLADNTETPPETEFYSVANATPVPPVLVSSSVVEVFCYEYEPPVPWGEDSTATYEQISRGSSGGGTASETQMLVCDYDNTYTLTEITYNYPDADKKFTYDDTFLHPLTYTASTGTFEGRSTREGTYTNTNEGNPQVPVNSVTNGLVQANMYTPIGSMGPVTREEYVDFGNGGGGSGWYKFLGAAKGHKFTKSAGDAWVQAFVEYISYDWSTAGLQPPVIFEAKAVAGVGAVGAAFDPLAQVSNATLTAAIQACIDLGAVNWDTPTYSKYYR